MSQPTATPPLIVYCTGEFEKQGGMPEISLGKTMEKPIFRKLPLHPGGEIYTVFDEESDFQVENAQFGQPGSKIWKNLIFKNLVCFHPSF